MGNRRREQLAETGPVGVRGWWGDWRKHVKTTGRAGMRWHSSTESLMELHDPGQTKDIKHVHTTVDQQFHFGMLVGPIH